VMWYTDFALPAVPGVLQFRELVVSVAADGPGRTAIRIDAEVQWLPARPAAENIPASARVVTITPLGFAPGDHQVTVTDPARVARIATAVNALPLASSRWLECLNGPGPGMQLTFRATASSRALAVVTAVGRGCPGVQIVVEGKPMPMLVGAAPLSQQVMTIAGFYWKPAIQMSTSTVSPSAPS
jgi:hypothetical protein